MLVALGLYWGYLQAREPVMTMVAQLSQPTLTIEEEAVSSSSASSVSSRAAIGTLNTESILPRSSAPIEATTGIAPTSRSSAASSERLHAGAPQLADSGSPLVAVALAALGGGVAIRFRRRSKTLS